MTASRVQPQRTCLTCGKQCPIIGSELPFRPPPSSRKRGKVSDSAKSASSPLGAAWLSIQSDLEESAMQHHLRSPDPAVATVAEIAMNLLGGPAGYPNDKPTTDRPSSRYTITHG
jgi:hypothetical protein